MILWFCSWSCWYSLEPVSSLFIWQVMPVHGIWFSSGLCQFFVGAFVLISGKLHMFCIPPSHMMLNTNIKNNFIAHIEEKKEEKQFLVTVRQGSVFVLGSNVSLHVCMVTLNLRGESGKRVYCFLSTFNGI